jgi:hypothetical protein
MPKTSAKELARRKEAARLQDEHRQWMEAQIDALEKQGLSAEEIGDELGLVFMKYSPVMEFLRDRLNRTSEANFDDEMHRAIVDLLRSDIALDRGSRELIASLLWRLAFPNTEAQRKTKRRAEMQFAEVLKRHYRERGMSGLEAEQQVVESLGLDSVAALRKRRHRAK